MSREDEDLIPLISMDYMYMRSNHDDREEGNLRLMTMLVIVDRRSRYIAAHVVKEKGADGSAIKVLRQELDYMGYRRIVCRNDQESPVEALKSAVKREWPGEMVPENSPVGEHQSNGLIERAIQSVQGMIRTMRDALEGRYRMMIDGHNPIVSWKVTHAAATSSRFQVGEDGKTPTERIMWRTCNRAQVEFRECVM